MAERSEWRVAAALLLIAVVLALMTSTSRGRQAPDPRFSTFLATPRGGLGLFLLLQELGIPVERRTTALVEAGPLPATLVQLAPREPFSPAEIDALLAWLDQGGKLMYAASGRDTITAALGLIVEPASRGSGPVAPAQVESHPFTAGTDSVGAFRAAFADSSTALLSAGAVPLLRLPDGRVTVVLVRRGDGTVLAWSDAEPLMNRSLPSSGAAHIVAQALDEFAGTGDAIQFDEYHHGFRGGGSPAQVMFTFFRHVPAGHMSLQLAIAGLGLLALLGSRLGSPHPSAPARRRSPLEHLHALARAYETGNARQRARHLLLVGVARRLGRRPPAAGEESIFLASLSSIGGPRSETATALLSEWRMERPADLTTFAHLADQLVMATDAPPLADDRPMASRPRTGATAGSHDNKTNRDQA